MIRAGIALAGLLLVLSLMGAGAMAARYDACAREKFLPAQIKCYLDAAETAGDPGVCEQAEDAAVRFNCLGVFAERTGDPAVCKRIAAEDAESQALRGACIAGVAVANSDVSLCDETTHPSLRDSCILMLVTEKGIDPALCQRIANPALQSACADSPDPP